MYPFTGFLVSSNNLQRVFRKTNAPGSVWVGVFTVQCDTFSSKLWRVITLHPLRGFIFVSPPEVFLIIYTRENFYNIAIDRIVW